MQILKHGKLKKADNACKPAMFRETGFPSPATHYAESSIDLHKELITHQDATFFIRVDGNAQAEMNIFHNDVLLIDRAVSPRHNSLALVVEAGCFKVIRVNWQEDSAPYVLWGVITYIIHKA
ncbi:MAG: peptidase S24 [Flavobacteriaceae bacterium]|nr:peptidase S24 [Flavobacteriaceae bacterium]